MYIHLLYLGELLKELKWDPLKNEWLKRTRGISFEEIILERLLAVKEHPQRPMQRLMLFEREGYVWCVPYMENDQWIFLKTLYPSRKFTTMFRK